MNSTFEVRCENAELARRMVEQLEQFSGEEGISARQDGNSVEFVVVNPMVTGLFGLFALIGRCIHALAGKFTDLTQRQALPH